MTNLIERLESATGPDRELDAAIARALNLAGSYTADLMGWDDVGHAIYKPGPHHYTASIDAALTLVDSRALWAFGNMEDGIFARVCWPNESGSFLGGYFEATGATPALAICIASLKAQEATK